jgi:hypothetical protein
MVIYGLVGVEIIKQKRVLKSIGTEYVTLDTIVSAENVSSKHPNSTMTVEVNAQSQAVHDEIEIGSASLSQSSSQPRPYDNITLAKTPRRRSRVSFRQYVFMPLMFFVILLAVWVAPTTNRVSSFINPNYVSYPLLLAVGSTGSLRGFWNGVVFITLGMKERKRQKELRRARS